MIAHLSELIQQAIAFIFGLKKHIDELTATVSDQSAKIKDLETQLYASSAARDANKATADAADAKVKELQDQAALLDAAGEELAAAITSHPEVPLAVAPDFTTTPVEPAPEPEITTATDKVDAIKEAQKADETATDPVAVDFAELDVVTAGSDPKTASQMTPDEVAAAMVDGTLGEKPQVADESATVEPEKAAKRKR